MLSKLGGECQSGWAFGFQDRLPSSCSDVFSGNQHSPIASRQLFELCSCLFVRTCAHVGVCSFVLLLFLLHGMALSRSTGGRSSLADSTMDMDECFSNAGIFDARQEERLHRHLDAVQCNADGAVCLVSSSLAGRVWDGCLWVYAAPFGQEERDELENQCSVATACHPVSAGKGEKILKRCRCLAAIQTQSTLYPKVQRERPTTTTTTTLSWCFRVGAHE